MPKDMAYLSLLHTPSDHRCRWSEGVCRSAEQEAIDRLLVPVGDAGDPGWQGEDDVEIFHWQKIFGLRRHPVSRRGSLAFGAVTVLA